MTPADLRVARRRLGLSQRALAEALGYKGRDRSRDIRRYENGERPVPEVVALKVERLLRAVPLDNSRGG